MSGDPRGFELAGRGLCRDGWEGLLTPPLADAGRRLKFGDFLPLLLLLCRIVTLGRLDTLLPTWYDNGGAVQLRPDRLSRFPGESGAELGRGIFLSRKGDTIFL